MQFSNPIFLWGLLAVSIPIIIHLFNFRRFKKIYFSNVSLLRDLKMESKRHARVKNLLLLFIRIFAIIALVLVFAQPFIPAQKQLVSGKKNIAIYIDNSLSLEADQSSGTTLLTAIQTAENISKGYGLQDEFQLLTNDFEGKHQRLLNREQFIEALQDVKLSPVNRSISEISERQKAALNNNEKSVSWIISDMQKSSIDFENFSPDTSLKYNLYPLDIPPVQNICVDSCWIDAPVVRPGQQIAIKVRVRNFSNQNLEKIPLKLYINNRQKGMTSVDIPAGETAFAEISFSSNSAGEKKCIISLEDYPVSFDDSYYFAFSIAEKIDILAITNSKKNPFLKRAFSLDSAFAYRELSVLQLDFAQLEKTDLVILDGLQNLSSGFIAMIENYVNSGGNLVVFPANDITIPDYNKLLNSFDLGKIGVGDTSRLPVSKINLESEVLKDIFTEIPENLDLPIATFHYPIGVDRKTFAETVISFANKEPFLLGKNFGDGHIWLFAVGADEISGDFVHHPFFVPVIYRLALLSVPPVNYNYVIGNYESARFKHLKLRNDEMPILKSLQDDSEIIPTVKKQKGSVLISFDDFVQNPGFYNLTANDSLVAILSFNINRKESDLTAWNSSEMQSYIDENGFGNVEIISDSAESLTKKVKAINEGKPLYRWFIWLAIFLFFCEIIVLRWRGRKSL